MNMANTTDTPWGELIEQYEITDGVYEINTVGHGGILVHVDVANTLLSQAAIARGKRYRDWYAYDEDCDIHLFVYEQAELYAKVWTKINGILVNSEVIKKQARKNLLFFHPDYLLEIEGKDNSIPPLPQD